MSRREMRFGMLQLIIGFLILYLVLVAELHFLLNLQFGYFSFGGSTVICVFEKVGMMISHTAHLYFS